MVIDFSNSFSNSLRQFNCIIMYIDEFNFILIQCIGYRTGDTGNYFLWLMLYIPHWMALLSYHLLYKFRFDGDLLDLVSFLSWQPILLIFLRLLRGDVTLMNMIHPTKLIISSKCSIMANRWSTFVICTCIPSAAKNPNLTFIIYTWTIVYIKSVNNHKYYRHFSYFPFYFLYFLERK